MDQTLFTELLKQAPQVGLMIYLVHLFLHFITEERKLRNEELAAERKARDADLAHERQARDLKDAAALAVIEKIERDSDIRAKECHRLQADANNALHRVAHILERIPQHMKES